MRALAWGLLLSSTAGTVWLLWLWHVGRKAERAGLVGLTRYRITPTGGESSFDEFAEMVRQAVGGGEINLHLTFQGPEAPIYTVYATSDRDAAEKLIALVEWIRETGSEPPNLTDWLDDHPEVLEE